MQSGTARVGDSPSIHFENTQCDITQALGLILHLNFEVMEDFTEQKRKNVIRFGLNFLKLNK